MISTIIITSTYRSRGGSHSRTPVCIELNTLSQSNKVDIIQFFLNILGFFLRIGLGSQKEIDIALLRFLSIRSMRMWCCAFTLKLLIIRLVIGKCTLLKSFCKIIFICVFLSLTDCLQQFCNILLYLLLWLLDILTSKRENFSSFIGTCMDCSKKTLYVLIGKILLTIFRVLNYFTID